MTGCVEVRLRVPRAASASIPSAVRVVASLGLMRRTPPCELSHRQLDALGRRRRPVSPQPARWRNHFHHQVVEGARRTEVGVAKSMRWQDRLCGRRDGGVRCRPVRLRGRPKQSRPWAHAPWRAVHGLAAAVVERASSAGACRLVEGRHLLRPCCSPPRQHIGALFAHAGKTEHRPKRRIGFGGRPYRRSGPRPSRHDDARCDLVEEEPDRRSRAGRSNPRPALACPRPPRPGRRPGRQAQPAEPGRRRWRPFGSSSPAHGGRCFQMPSRWRTTISHPNVNTKASTPGSPKTISNVRSAIAPRWRISWYSRCRRRCLRLAPLRPARAPRRAGSPSTSTRNGTELPRRRGP